MKKYWMSLIVALSTLACVCGAETAAAPKVSVKAVGPDKAVVSGQSFDVKLNFTTSSPVEIMTTTFFADAKKAPADFAAKAKLQYNAKWKTVRIRTASFPPADRLKTEHKVSIATTGWPAGDYLIWVSCYYRVPGTKNYLNCPAKFPLTIIEAQPNSGK